MSQQLDLYLGVDDGKLRYFTVQGQLMLTPEEYRIQVKEYAQQEKLRANYEKKRAELLAAKLRELNIDTA